MDDKFDEEGKLGHGFMSADELEEVDIGFGDRPRPIFVSAKLDLEFERKLIELLREYRDCIVWEYYEMLGLSWSIIEHRFPTKLGGLDRSYIQISRLK